MFHRIVRLSIVKDCILGGNSKLVSKNLRWQVLTGGRNFSQSQSCRESFKIQDVKDFEEKVIGSDVPVIVDFFATWCNPCRALTPRLESVIAERKGKVKLAKVDIDEHTDLALEYEVASVPVILGMKNGKEKIRLVGLQDMDKLNAFVDQVLQK
ncbi:hypothetical protein J437_LFUL007459 [Ladona fulva]|uniref:Thioredoxin domain-containing protein n=1 Tax=Ladona fulva TaxID=123851 RepID=A0A8K0KAQ1_LADFU|nr:hypothetical protein J437_LFUL007459 [Ladona fulva]